MNQQGKKKVLLLHPNKQYVYSLAAQLYQTQLLGQFVTGFAIGDDMAQKLQKLLPRKLHNFLKKRTVYGVPDAYIQRIWLNEILFLLCRKRVNNVEKLQYHCYRLFQWFVRQKKLSQFSCIIGFDTTCWQIAAIAQQLQIPFILDQSIGAPNAKEIVFQKIVRQFPHIPHKPKLPFLIQLEAQEHQFAKAIVVASTFTKQTLLADGVSPAKIYTNPYGVEERFLVATPKPLQYNADGTVHIKLVSFGLINARKGFHITAEAFQQLPSQSATCTAIGNKDEVFLQSITPLIAHIQFQPAVLHAHLPSALQQHDVFVFPSLFEGFGLVILEAMACGLAVIASKATAGPDIIEHLVDGYILENTNAESLAKAIIFLQNNPSVLRNMQQNAIKKAANYTWDAYGQRWTQIIKEVTN